jgi:hypothetical protein
LTENSISPTGSFYKFASRFAQKGTKKISRVCPFGVVELPAAAEVDFPVVVELFVAVVIMNVAAVADVFVVVATVVTVEMFCASAVCSTTERLSTIHAKKLN